MKQTYLLGGFLAVAIAASACGSDMGEPMSHRLEELDDSIAAIAAAASAHETAISSASTLGEMSLEETAYASSLSGMDEDLHHLMEDMSMCGHGDDKLDVTELAAVAEDVEAELEAHGAAMSNAADAAAAAEEETRHQTRMEELVASMHSHHQAMAEVGADYMCMGDSH